MNCSHSVRWAFGAVLFSAVLSFPAFAEHRDPAPIAEEAVQKVLDGLRANPPHPLPEILRQHLDETQEIVRQMERDEAGGITEDERMTRFENRRALLASKLHELEMTRSELRAQFAQTRAKLVSLKLNEKVKAWNALQAKVEQRFDRMKRALDGVHRSHGKAERSASMAEVMSILRDSHESVKNREAVPSADPVPTVRTIQPTTIKPSRTRNKDVPPPQYLSSPRPSNNLYAFLGDTLLLAALPDPTPTEASACVYNAADLAQNQEIQLTPEIKALAEQLEYSPVKIYQHVQNNIKYEPYWGSLKGAQGTLISGAGNATDQASLLIALLRASNIPARYVQGTVDFENDDPRALRWLGAKSFPAAAAILAAGYVPSYYDPVGKYFLFYHVWAEACVPYGNYRGTGVDKTGHRWIPLDPSYKDSTYQAGIATNVAFDYTNYMAARTDRLPLEKYESQVESSIKSSNPNNTLEDVGYIGKPVLRKVDILPASLPYLVSSFNPWDGVAGPAETAQVPDTHRYKLAVTVKNSSNQSLLTTTLSLPQQALQRLTLSYIPYSSADQTIWNTWNGDLKNLPAGVVNVKPVIKVEGVDKAVGTVATPLGQSNYLILKLTLAEYSALPWCEGDPGTTGVDPDTHCANKSVYNAIKAGGYHALQAYAFQASDQLLAQRAAKLLTSVRASPAPTTPPPYLNDETTGEFLHLALSKYMRYYTDSGRRISDLDGVYSKPGNHLGLTSSGLKVQYLFDVPFAVFPDGLLVDVKNALFMPIDHSTGQYVWKTFKLQNYNGSALEHYIWQETARLDAVSTVRGLQYAKETGIVIVTLNSSNIASYDTLMDPSMAPYKTVITNYVNKGFVITVPKRTISYTGQNQTKAWNGAVFLGENQSVYQAVAVIDGSLGGGYALLNPPPITFTPYNNPFDSYASIGYKFPTPPPSTVTSVPSLISSAIGLGSTPYITLAGDPVNMVTGNMYHNERDINLKGRGGFPIVFERSYNSRDAKDGPLGFGWTHSLNHYLMFKDDNVNDATDPADTDNVTSSVSWTDGTASEKFIQVTGTSSGVAVGSVFTPPKGFFFQTVRNADGTYSIREKNGLTYTFENVAGTKGQKAKLLNIKDRNGNTLSMGYTGSNLTSVTDGLGRALTFTPDGNNRITQITDWTGRQWKYEYNTSGDLITYKNPLAVSSPATQPPVTYEYYTATYGTNLNHAMKKYSLPRGNGMTFEYYMNGKVFKHYSTLGETTTFTYNDFRRETVSVNERGYTRRFFFDEYGNTLRIVEENGAIREYSYETPCINGPCPPFNPYNRLSKRDPMGYTTSYVYDLNGNVVQINNPSSVVSYRYFNSFNQPGRMEDARGNYTLYKYDAKGNVLQEIKLKSGYGSTVDPVTYTPVASQIAAWTINTYDAYGNVLTTKRVRDFTSQVGPSTEYSYNDTVNNVSGLNAVTVTRRGDKNGDGTIDTPDTATLVYDVLGRVKTGIDADWHTKQYFYDSLDRITRATDATGNLRDYAYDTNGNPAGESLTAAVNGVSTLQDSASASYNLSDRKTVELDAAGNAMRYNYDAAGNVIQIINPDNYSLSFEYDAGNHVTKAYDREGNAVTSTLDLDGKPRTVTDPNRNTVKYEYYGPERDGRLKTQKDALNRATTYDYDANGNTISVADNLGRSTRTTYDELNRPTRAAGPSYTDATYGLIRPLTKYTYDNLGNLAKVEAGRTDSTGTNAASDVVTTQMTYVLDDFGRKLKETDPLSKFWTYEYDVNNNLTKATDAKNQITQYTWGHGHQLQTRTDYSGKITYYTRNALGQPITVQSPAVSYNYAYDDAHRVKSVNDSRGSKTLTYSYSPGGMLNSMIDSDGNRTDYLYDPIGRLTGIWAPNWDYTAYAYDPAGRLTEKWLPNGVNTRYRYNTDNTLAQVQNRNPSGGTVSQHDYTYDTVGNRQTHIELVSGVTTPYKYVYDELNRLKEVRNNTTNALIEAYGHDPLGNRKTRTVGATTYYYNHDAANAIQDIRTGSPTGTLTAGLVYDNNGNLTKKCESGTVTRSDTACSGTTVTTLTYNALDQLTQATKTGLAPETYVYDDQGKRLQKIGSSTTNYLYSGPDINAEYGTSWTTPVALYAHGPNWDDPILRTAGTATQYYHQDGLGSAVAVTDQTGATTGSARYDAFGVKLASTGTIAQYGYTGREPDATGLIYYRARYYDPSIGRFTQRDPIGFKGGINQYVYVNNSPVNYTDPTGLLPADVPRMSAAAAAYYGGNPVIASTGQSLASYRNGANDTLDTAWNVVTSLIPGSGIGEAFSQAAEGNLGLAVMALATEIPWFKGARMESKIMGGVEREGARVYDIGAASALRARSIVGDSLDIHHVGQSHPMGQLVPGYNPNTAPAIAVPQLMHQQIPTLSGPYTGTARDLLAKDIRDLRNYTDAPNSSLQELIRLNKQMYPGTFGKP